MFPTGQAIQSKQLQDYTIETYNNKFATITVPSAGNSVDVFTITETNGVIMQLEMTIGSIDSRNSIPILVINGIEKRIAFDNGANLSAERNYTPVATVANSTASQSLFTINVPIKFKTFTLRFRSPSSGAGTSISNAVVNIIYGK